MTIAEAIQKVTAEYAEKGITPYEINNGSCEEWANEVAGLLGLDVYSAEQAPNPEHKVEIWETLFGYAYTTHAFVRIDGKFYDAECQEGVDDHMDMPIFKKLLASTGRRQPVWCIDTNHKNVESRRDISDAILAEYNRVNEIET